MAKCLAGLSFLALVAAPGAHACSIVSGHRQPTEAALRDSAEKDIADASLIFDGEVVEAGVDGGRPAKVRVHRLFKGSAGAFVSVYGDTGDCRMAFERVGQRWRFILFGTPADYHAWLPEISARPRYIDRLLKSDRRKDWPVNPR